MKYLSIFIVSLLSSVFALPAIAQGLPVVPHFYGGIDRPAAQDCLKKIQHSQCQLKNLSRDYKTCIEQVLSKEPECRQSLVFFKLSGGGLFEKIRKYRHLDVVLANYQYISTQGSSYFIITPAGQFIVLPITIPKDALFLAKGYTNILKYYPHAKPWQILAFPHGLIISKDRYRLVFTQQLNNGCSACTIAGKVQVAYDFSSNGQTFYGIQVLNVVPKNQLTSKSHAS